MIEAGSHFRRFYSHARSAAPWTHPVIQTLKLNDPTLLMDRCLIGGEWVGQPVDPVDNPATGEILSRVPRFGAAGGG